MESKTLRRREKQKKSKFTLSSTKLNLLFHTNPMGDAVVNPRNSVVYPIHVFSWSFSWNLQSNGKSDFKQKCN